MDFKDYYQRMIFDPDISYLDTIGAKRGDTKTIGLYVQIAQKSQIVSDITGLTMRCYCLKPDKTSVFIEAVVEEEYFRIDFTNQVFTVAGFVIVELELRGPDGESISSKSFNLIVTTSLRDDSALESTNEYGALVTSLAKVDFWNSRIDAVEADYIDRANVMEEQYPVELNNLTALMAENAQQLNDIPQQNYITEKAKTVDVNSAFAVRDAQIASLASGAPKAVSLVSEMTDITKNYVYTGSEGGYTSGHWYYWDGSTWISGGVYQSTSIADKSVIPTKTSFMDLGKNRLDESTAEVGFYIVTSTGVKSVNGAYTAVENIYIADLDSIAISPTLYGYAFKDIDNVFISGGLGGDIVAVPTNAVYVSVSAKHADIPTSKWQIESGTKRTDYEPYGYKVNELNLPKPILVNPTISNGEDDILSASFSTLQNITRVSTQEIEYDGLLKSLTFRCNIAGIIKIKVFSNLGSNRLKLEKEFTFTTTAGLYTYRDGVDFSNITVKRGWVVGGFSTVGVYMPTDATTAGNSYYLASDTVVGNTYTFTTMAYRLLLKYDVEVQSIDSIVEKTLSYSKAPTNEYILTDFKDVLADGLINQGWTIGNGALSPVVGGFDKRLYWNSGVNIEDAYFRAKIKLNDLTTNFLITRWGLNLSATGVEFNAVENKLKFLLGGGASVDYLSYPESAFDITIPFALVVGREYLFECYWRDNSYQEFSIVDGVTGEKATLVNNRATTLRRFLQHSNLSVIPITGNFIIKKWEYTTKQPIEPVLAIYGDSFIDGDSLNPNPENRYAAKVKTDLGGKVLICGKGGETSTGLLAKFDEEFNKYKPKYTLIAIGTNDSVFATWLLNVQRLIEKIEAKGSIPILATLTKMTALERTAFMTEVNNWILTSGYRYLDANLVTTINQDRQTQDTSLFFGDGIHPNVAGQDTIYKRFKIDLAEVYDYYESTK